MDATPIQPEDQQRRCARDGCEGALKKRQKKYCSQECFRVDTRSRVTCTCQQCGDEFEVPLSRFKKGRVKYCSRECYGLSKLNRVTLNCERCGCEFDAAASKSARKYCSQRCNGIARRNRVACTCEQCGVAFKVKKHVINDGRGKYCSRECCNLGRRSRIECECEQCGKTFERVPSKGSKYCSMECKGLAFQNRVTCTCEHCGVTFERRASQIERGGGRYCSNKCQGIGQRNRVDCTCKECGKQFRKPASLAGECCSRACANRSQLKRVELECEQCGKAFDVKASYMERGGGVGRFCSNECYGVARFNPNSDRLPLIRGLGKYTRWRRRVLNASAGQCVWCDEPATDVDHITPFSTIVERAGLLDCPDEELHQRVTDCEALWDVRNGRALCRDCHLNTGSWGSGDDYERQVELLA